MNATSKGVSLGIFEEGKGKGLEATQGGGQPYVDFMGRRRAFLPLSLPVENMRLLISSPIGCERYPIISFCSTP